MAGLLRVLLIEDTVSDTLLMKECLKESGVRCDVQVAVNPEEAFDFSFDGINWRGGSHPDIIILDLDLRGLNGAEVLRRLKSDAHTRSIPVIVFSSSETEADIRDCYDLHANCYVQKPMTLEAVLRAVKSIATFWGQVAELPNQF